MGHFEKIEDLKPLSTEATLLLTNGFEQRVPVAAARMHRLGLKFYRVILICYPGEEHRENLDTMRKLGTKLSIDGNVVEVAPSAADLIGALDLPKPRSDLVVCDISGLSRSLMFRVLTRLFRNGFRVKLLYTEAKYYYPLKKDFLPYLTDDQDTAFSKLLEYEEGEIVHSSSCVVEEMSEHSGEMIPSYPTLLIAFLSYKRSRLSAILNQYETNARILISSKPVRRDLQWRGRALQVINFDLIAGSIEPVHELPTLYWRQTWKYLDGLYQRNSAGYRYNIVFAPLGGKMQTIGSWLFAFTHPDVKVVTSTPKALFPEKYSIGFKQTHLVSLPEVLGG